MTTTPMRPGGCAAAHAAANRSTKAKGRSTVKYPGNGPYNYGVTRRFLAASLLAAVAFAPQAFATVTFLPGSSPQQAPAGKAFAPILMRVTNAFEHPVAGATVQWSVPGGIHALKTISFPDCGPDGFGFGLTCRTATDADGIASIPPMIGNWALTHELSIWSAYGDAKAVLIVDPLLDPPRLRIVGGDQQRAVAGTAYASPLRLRAERSDGSAVAGAKVRFLVTGPPYVKFPNSIAFGPDGGWAVWITTTDADGNASSAPFEADLGLGSGVVVAEITDEEARATSSTRFSFTNTNAEGGFTFDVGHDLWWGGPQEGGWAISITQHRDQLFAFLLAYDEGGNPTWAMLPGGQWSNGFGGRFDAGL